MKFLIKFLVLSLFFALLVYPFQSCQKEPLATGLKCDTCLTAIGVAGKDSAAAKNCSDFKDFLTNLSPLQQPKAIPEPVAAGAPQEEVFGKYRCTVTRYKWAPEYNELFLLNPTSDVFYPGAMFRGETVITGEYNPIVAKRAKMRLSTSLVNISNSPSIVIERPSLSTVREGINTLLSGTVTGSTAAQVNFDVEEVRSEEEVRLNLKANFSGWGVSVKASYDFSNTTIKSRFLVRFQQVYYTIDMDAPDSPCALFDSLPNPASLGAMPLVVSSVVYGRVIYFMVESSASKETTRAALEASYKMYGGIGISQEHKKVLNESSIRALIVGGDGNGAAAAVTGIDDLVKFMKTGGNYSKNSPGAPIAYKMRFLKDWSVAKFVMASEYNIRDCELIQEIIKVTPLQVEQSFCPNRNIGGHDDWDAGPTVREGGVDFTESERFLVRLRPPDAQNIVWADIRLVMMDQIDCDPGKRNNGHTYASVTERIPVYKIPDGRVFRGFVGDEFGHMFQYTDNTDYDDMRDLDTPGFTGDMIQRVEVMGNTGGPDLPCGDPNGPDRSWLKIYFKPIDISVVPK